MTFKVAFDREYRFMIETLGDDFFKTLATNFLKLAGSLETHPDNSDLFEILPITPRFPRKPTLKG